MQVNHVKVNHVKVFSLAAALALTSTGSAAVAQGGRRAAKERKPLVHTLPCANGGKTDKLCREIPGAAFQAAARRGVLLAQGAVARR